MWTDIACTNRTNGGCAPARPLILTRRFSVRTKRLELPPFSPRVRISQELRCRREAAATSCSASCSATYALPLFFYSVTSSVKTHFHLAHVQCSDQRVEFWFVLKLESKPKQLFVGVLTCCPLFCSLVSSQKERSHGVPRVPGGPLPFSLFVVCETQVSYH